MAGFHPGEMSLEPYVLSHTYLLMAMTGLGYLALTWSTVVLLGGFVTSLQRKDFLCLTVISMMQAARIFNDLGDQLVPKFLNLLIISNCVVVAISREWLTSQTINQKLVPAFKISPWLRVVIILYTGIIYMLFLPLLAACYIVVFLYGSGGPVACIGLALWRIVQRDYSSNDGDVSKANLAPALDMFYSLILCQGALYLLWLCWDRFGPSLLASLGQDYKIPRKWRYITLVEYLFDTRAKCWRDPASIQGRTISHYAVDLIDSGSWEDNLSGARMLATFIRQGADVRSLLLPSRPRIQKLIDTLGWRAGPSREIRESAARIVAQLAGDIHLAQFPGAIRCISFLLQDEATLTYWRNGDQQQQGRPHLHTGPRSTTEALIPLCDKSKRTRQKREVDQQGGDDDVQQKKHEDDEVGGSCNELILQGLTILERLALDHQNCLDICSAPGVLPKITTPLYSATLIQDIKIRDWADIVNRCFKVLNRLICAPGKIGRRLRREISTNKQAVSNLESILDERNEAGQELQMGAMEILRKLALDLSINLTRETKENLITKQLRIFLADEEGEEPAAMLNPLKATAGRTLVFLSTNSEMNSAIVMSGYNDSFSRLTEKLDAKNNITYRIIAAEILENMCAHCDLDKERVKQTLLPMILTELQSNKREPLQSGKENQKKSALGDDEENQKKSAPGDDEENQKKSATGNEEQTPAKELQEAFLSLTLVIYDKLTSADDFDEVQKEAPGQGAFVAKLKTIVKENAEATVISLRTVKLCGQIVVSMMRRKHYTEHFKNQGFVESLSQAKKIMSNLESCMLFAGTDLDVKKIDRPLLSELEKEALELVG